MRHIKCMASWGFVFFGMFILISQVTASSAPSTAQGKPNEVRGYCNSDAGESVIYFSDVFTAVPLAQGKAALQSLDGPVKKAFEEFLKQKYSFNGSSSCGFGSTSAASIKADADRKRTLFKSQNKRIIDTGWKYTAK